MIKVNPVHQLIVLAFNGSSPTSGSGAPAS
jgi:hypothetical protein